MDLTFIDQLDDEQIKVANKIVTQAKRMGIPSSLALSIAFRESSLRPNVKPGAAGEIGIMQVLPETAKMFGVDVKNLANENTNIITGLKYLKQALDKSEGDPMLAALGYNAGIGAITSDAPIPESTRQYLKDLRGFGAFGAAKPSAEPPPSEPRTEAPQPAPEPRTEAQQPPVAQTAPPASPSAAPQAPAPLSERITSLLSQQTSGALDRVAPPMITPEEARYAGMAAGSFPAVVDVKRSMFGQPRRFFTEPPVQPTTSQTGLTAGQKWGGNWAGMEPERLENVRGVPEAAQKYQLGKPHGKVTSEIYKRFGDRPLDIARWLESQPKQLGVLEQLTAKFGQMAETGLRALGTIGKYAVPPLALGEAGYEGVKAYQEATKPEPDYGEVALSGLGAAGALTSLAAPMVGLPMMAIPPVVRGYREHERLMQTDPEYAEKYERAFAGMGQARRFPKPEEIMQ